jgi:hypothetical protein
MPVTDGPMDNAVDRETTAQDGENGAPPAAVEHDLAVEEQS